MLSMIIVDLQHLRIEGEISESDLFYVDKNQRVSVTIPSLDYKTSGVIRSIVPSANPMAHTFKVIIDFRKKIRKIFPGMHAKVLIHIDEHKIKN